MAPAERHVLARALVLLPLAALSLRSLGLRRTQAAMMKAAHLLASRNRINAESVARIVELAARHGPFHVRCLSTSLALQSLLAANGIAGELRLGVRKRGTRLEAHAWVEHQGVALMERGDVHSRFSAFDAAIAHTPARMR